MADLDQVPRELYDRIWAILTSIDERERHFNDLQSRYRALASTWLLATFTGIGFMFSNQVRPPVDSEVMSVAIAIAGAIGITLLWVVDVLVYHELLIAAYIVGKRLERLYPWLPPIRSNFSFLTRGPAVRWYVAAFYLAGIAVVCLLGAGISLFWDSPDRYRLLAAPLAIGATLCAFIVLFTRRAIRKKDGVPDWTPQMSRPGA